MGPFFFCVCSLSDMSQVPDCLNATQDDIAKLLACDSHTGSTNCDKEMTRYVFKRRGDGVYIFNLLKTWKKKLFWLLVVLLLLKTHLTFAPSLPELMDNVLFSNTQSTLVLTLLLVDLLLVPLPIKSKRNLLNQEF